ncbi:MAG: DUF4124 domain-containing protein [Gammaproteobacteria bacterium]|nr:DUF4124 domain-containing protein [Gammaproteobacteria bacterium]
MRKILVMVLLLGCAAASAAGVYKWVDENGKVHYGDHPGNSSAREVILPATPAPDENQRAHEQKQKKLLQVFEEERQEKREQEAKAKAEQQKREHECTSAKARLKNYEYAGELTTKDKDGKERTLSKAEYKQALADAKQAVEHWCR